MLELLAQGERTVDLLATEMDLSLANGSQRLQTLRQAALVESRKDGLFVHYRLADPDVFELSRSVRTVAERRRQADEIGCNSSDECAEGIAEIAPQAVDPDRRRAPRGERDVAIAASNVG